MLVLMTTITMGFCIGIQRERDRARVNQIIKNQPNSIEEQTNKQSGEKNKRNTSKHYTTQSQNVSIVFIHWIIFFLALLLLFGRFVGWLVG